MIGKFEYFIKNSGFEATCAIYYIAYQVLLSLFLVFLISIFKNSNFIDLDELYKKFLQISMGVFIMFFVIFIYNKKGISKIISSFFKLLFFYLFASVFINQTSTLVVPKSYEDIDSFILEENIFEDKKYKKTFIELLIKKIFNKNS